MPKPFEMGARAGLSARWQRAGYSSGPSGGWPGLLKTRGASLRETAQGSIHARFFCVELEFSSLKRKQEKTLGQSEKTSAKLISFCPLRG